MQTYKKSLSMYLGIACFLLLLFYTLSNWILSFSDASAAEIINFVISVDGLNDFVNHFFIYFLMFQPISLAAGLMGFLCGLLGYVYKNDKGVYRHNEEHGSARFAKESEMAKYADNEEKNNIILTEKARMGIHNDRLPIAVQRNKNICVIGDPGAGKTRFFVKPNLMQMQGSYIVTDPKGLLVRETGKMLEDAGYKIKIFDLANLANSDHFNVFKYIKTELDVDRVLEQITEGTKKGDKQGEDFWIKAEALLIRAFIAFLWFDGKDNDYLPDLSMIGDMLRFCERKDPKIPSPVEDWFEEQHEKHPNNYAYKQWSLFNDLYRAETRASVLAIAAARYSVFDHEQVVDMVKEDTMDIDSWNEEKTAVFITIPETSDSYNFLSAIFLATAMETLRHKVDNILSGEWSLAPGKTLLHVRLILDEFANIGRIPNIEKFLGTFRSRNMSIVIILQALDQLKKMYEKGWASIVTLCASLLFLGGEEEDTMKYLSKRAGKQTISIRNSTEQNSRRSGGSINKQKQGRDLMTPDEISRLSGMECLLFISKEYVFKDQKYPLENHPNVHLLADKPGDPNWYKYKRYRNEVEELLDKITPDQLIDHGVIESEAA